MNWTVAGIIISLVAVALFATPSIAMMGMLFAHIQAALQAAGVQ